MNVTEDAWHDEQDPSTPQTLPQAVCIDGKCSVGTTSHGQLLLSEPLQKPGAAGNSIPVYSVREYYQDFSIATLLTLNSANAADTRTILIQKTGVDPTQPTGYNLPVLPRSLKNIFHLSQNSSCYPPIMQYEIL
jgi:hypothetical protein